MLLVFRFVRVFIEAAALPRANMPTVVNIQFFEGFLFFEIPFLVVTAFFFDDFFEFGFLFPNIFLFIFQKHVHLYSGVRRG
jgi:hypothetical protein